MELTTLDCYTLRCMLGHIILSSAMIEIDFVIDFVSRSVKTPDEHHF